MDRVDNSDTGRGILLCTACGEPYRDHPLTEPCKALAGIRLTLPAGKQRRSWKHCRVCGDPSIRSSSVNGKLGRHIGLCDTHQHRLGTML